VYTIGALNCDLICGCTNAGPNIEFYEVGTSLGSACKNRGYVYMSGTSTVTHIVAGVYHSRGGSTLAGVLRNCVGYSSHLQK